MPNKSSTVKNKKQHEALQDKGMPKGRVAKIVHPPNSPKHGGKSSDSGGKSSRGGTSAQKKQAGRKAGRKGGRSSSKS